MVTESRCRKVARGSGFDRRTSLSKRFAVPYADLRPALEAVEFPILCTYYSSHPGGPHYETFQVNANEAESRRIARSREIRHTPGRFEMPKEDVTLEYP